MPFDRVLVVGLGLIGGSIAKALQPHYDIVVHDPDADVMRRAAADGFTLAPTIADTMTPATLVVIAAPVEAIPETLALVAEANQAVASLPGTADQRDRKPLVTDVCSVKQSVIDTARECGLRFVGGHPMAGSEHHGYGAATDSLFSGARWALAIDDTTDLDDWFAVAHVVGRMGAAAMPVRGDAHDRAVAAISHLPHVLAAGLASVTDGPDGDLMVGLAAGSFRDGTRVARSSPHFWASVLADNGANMVPLLRSMSSQLATLADELAAGDALAVHNYFAVGARERVRYENRNAVAHTIICDTDADARRVLLDIGARGGSVTGHERVDGRRNIHVRVPDAVIPRALR